MKISETGLKDAVIIDPTVHGDERGYFFEGFSRQRILEATGYEFDAAQANHSRSTQNILRGLHYQIENGSKVVDPLTYHGAIRRRVDGAALSGLMTETGRLDAVFNQALAQR